MRMGLGNNINGRITMVATAFAAALAVPAAVQAAPYYLQFNLTNSSTPTTFNVTSAWFDQESGGGNNPATLNGNSFYTNGFIARGSDQTYTFGDTSTELHFNSKVVIRAANNTRVTTIHNLFSYGANAQIAAGGGAVHLETTSFVNAVTTKITGDGNSNRAVTLTAATLSGGGDLVLDNANTKLVLNVADASGFTGNLTWFDNDVGTIDFETDLVSGGGLIVPDNGRLVLDQDVTFAHVTIAGVDLTPGLTYTYQELQATFSEIFLPVTTEGSITVAVPEPAGLMLAACGSLLALRRRRA